MRVIAFEHTATVMDLLATSGAVPAVDGTAPDLLQFTELLDTLGMRPAGGRGPAPVEQIAGKELATEGTPQTPSAVPGRQAVKRAGRSTDEELEATQRLRDSLNTQPVEPGALASGLLGLFVPLALVQRDVIAPPSVTPGQSRPDLAAPGVPGSEGDGNVEPPVDLTAHLQDAASESHLLLEGQPPSAGATSDVLSAALEGSSDGKLPKADHEGSRYEGDRGALQAGRPGSRARAPLAPEGVTGGAIEADPAARTTSEQPSIHARPLTPRQSLSERFAAFLDSIGTPPANGGTLASGQITRGQELPALRMTLSTSEPLSVAETQRLAADTVTGQMVPGTSVLAGFVGPKAEQLDPATATSGRQETPAPPISTPADPEAVAAQPHEAKGPLLSVPPLRSAALRLVKANRVGAEAHQPSAELLRITRDIDAALAAVPPLPRWSPAARELTLPDAPVTDRVGPPPIAVPTPILDTASVSAATVSAPAVTEAASLPADIERELQPQIVQALRMQWMSGAGEAQVRLDPEFLGDVTVRISVERNVVSATLSADVPAVRQWLETHLDSLAEALREQGLHLERVVVEDEGFTFADDGERRHRHDENGDDRPSPRRVPSPEADQPRFEVVL